MKTIAFLFATSLLFAQPGIQIGGSLRFSEGTSDCSTPDMATAFMKAHNLTLCGAPVVIGTGNNPVTSGLFLTYQKDAPASTVLGQFELTTAASNSDSGAMRAVAYVTGGMNSAMRAGEFHTIRQSTASFGSTWGIEVGIHSEVATTSAESVEATAISLLSGSYNGPKPIQRANVGVLVWGDAGYYYPIKVLDTDMSRLFDVDRYGAISFKGTGKIRYESSRLQYSNNGGATWANLGGGFPMVDAGTYPIGMMTEVNNSLLNFGVNDNRFGAQVTSYQGGFMRFDGRPGEKLFQWFGRVPGAPSPSLLMTLDSSGSLNVANGLNSDIPITCSSGWQGILSVRGGIVTASTCQ